MRHLNALLFNPTAALAGVIIASYACTAPVDQCTSDSECGECQACVNGACVLESGRLNACGQCAPEPVEICADGIDNDCSGQRDEAACLPPCVGGLCTAPSATFCLDAQTLRTYANPGTCMSGGCTYQAVDITCQLSCDSAARACLGCNNTCATAGLSECNAGESRTCQVDANGCLEWGVFTPCASGFCADNAGCGVCANACASVGAAQCTAGEVRTCIADANGCLAWSGYTSCSDGFCADAGACGACNHQCAGVGLTECSAGESRACQADANGCRAWGPYAACADGFCLNSTTCGTCTHGCSTVGAAECLSGEIRACVSDANDCRAWGQYTACADGFCADSTTCGVCTDGCPAAGVAQCTSGQFRTCEPDANGCLAWSSYSACTSGFCADNTSCGNCTNTCTTAGATECASGQLRTCEADTNGCRAWSSYSSCPEGFCANSASCGTCSNTCPTAGAVECASGQMRTCQADANGCLAWSGFSNCAEGFCASSTACGVCANTCSPAGTTECTAGQVRSCVADANNCRSWGAYAACAEGFCANATTCGTCTNTCPSAGASECSNGQLRTCTADVNGCLAWSGFSNCAEGFCANATTCGVCNDSCAIEGATDCSAGALRTCIADSNGCLGWGAYATCAEGACASLTRCGVPSLVISSNTELCGDHSYGTLTIQGGATVTCATGTLNVIADEITVDPASAIDLSGASSVTSGSNSPVCNGGPTSYAVASGAGGGGNATTGSGGSVREYGFPGSCNFCSGGAGGPVRGRSYNTVLASGGKGGDGCGGMFGTVCSSMVSGGKGGGAVSLVATQRINVMGAVRVQGGVGATSTGDLGGGAGGGAGGSILLAAPELALSGSLLSGGGSGGSGTHIDPTCNNHTVPGGSGGSGWVKLLYGGSLSRTGATVGVSVVTHVPPMTFSSSTHPRTDLVYNDDFSNLRVAWQAPYGTVQGYWYKLSQDGQLQLSAANGAFTTGAAVSFPASEVTAAGPWYVHVLSSDPTDGPATVSNAFRVTINATPHSVSSSSHPSPTAWYSGTAVALSWTPPATTTAASFRGFWYRLDRESAPSPANANAQWTFTPSTSIVLTQDAEGQAISSFAYYFHLVAEDTQGRLTKQAAHFLIQVGSEPPRMNYYGYVRTASNVGIQGALVRMQPYGLSVGTDVNGYFIFDNIYQGPYTLTASKAGYTTTTTPVTVAPANVPASVTLTP